MALAADCGQRHQSDAFLLCCALSLGDVWRALARTILAAAGTSRGAHMAQPSFVEQLREDLPILFLYVG